MTSQSEVCRVSWPAMWCTATHTLGLASWDGANHACRAKGRLELIGDGLCIHIGRGDRITAMTAHRDMVCVGGGSGAAQWDLRLCGSAPQPKPIADLLSFDWPAVSRFGPQPRLTQLQTPS